MEKQDVGGGATEPVMLQSVWRKIDGEDGGESRELPPLVPGLDTVRFKMRSRSRSLEVIKKGLEEEQRERESRNQSRSTEMYRRKNKDGGLRRESKCAERQASSSEEKSCPNVSSDEDDRVLQDVWAKLDSAIGKSDPEDSGQEERRLSQLPSSESVREESGLGELCSNESLPEVRGSVSYTHLRAHETDS